MDTTQTTLRWETVRASLVRPVMLASQGSGVFLLVGIQHFDASGVAKALVTSAAFAGMLLAPFVVQIVVRRQVSVTSAIAALMVLSAGGVALAGLSSSLTGFVAGVLIGVPLVQSSLPLVTSMWQHNVPTQVRGRLFGIVGSISGLVGVAAGLVIAWYMGDDAGRYPAVLIALSLALVLAAFASQRIPSYRLVGPVRNPLQQLSLLKQNPTFGYLVALWFMLGLGNLASLPLRVEYIASGEYGFEYSARLVLFLTVVVPQGVSLVATLFWGRWFDRFDFLWVRLAINLTFMASIVMFFRPSLAAQVVGSALFGVGIGGGLVVWNLWVTKYAEPDRTADYMAVHTMMTGVRGVVAPFLAYELLSRLPLLGITRVSLGLLTIGSLMLVPLMLRQYRATRSGMS